MNFEARLTGGHPNSLGNTLEIVAEVLADPSKFDELFHCYFSDDEIVRLRVSNAVKRVCLAQKETVVPYLEKLLTEITQIDQASTQWTLALLFDYMRSDLEPSQFDRALQHLKYNLTHHSDWIVLNNTMQTLGKWAKEDEALQVWMKPHLARISKDERKSVSKRAVKLLEVLAK